jgi:DNA repair exonuclease SbcCD ATPase subunit
MRSLSLSLLLAALLVGFAAAQSRRPSPFSSANRVAEPVEETEATQPAPARPTRATTNRAGDPFEEELKSAFAAEARWLTLHQALMEELDSSPPCAEQLVGRIQEAQDAAFEMFGQRTNYLQRHQRYAAELRKKLEEEPTRLAVDRAELDAHLNQIAQELASAQRRRTELASSLRTLASPDDSESLVTLDQIITKLEREKRLTEDTLREYDQSREHLRALLRWARERERASSDQLALVKAESRLWKAFYDGVTLRVELRCHQNRPGPYVFPTRSPREVLR